MKISRQEFRKIILEELEALPDPKRRRVVRATKGGRKQPLQEMQLDEMAALAKGAMDLLAKPGALEAMGAAAAVLLTTGLVSSPEDAEELVSASSEDAVKLYVAMKGGGTKEADIEEVFNRRSNDISALSDEYSRLLAAAGESGDLASWLASDGMSGEADLVRAAAGQTHQADAGDASIGDRVASGGGLGKLARTGEFDPVAIATGGVGSMDNLMKGPLGEGLSDSRRVKFTEKALRRRIRRELFGGDDTRGPGRTVRVTRRELNQILLEEFSLSGIGGALSSMGSKVRSAVGGGDRRKMVGASSEDAVKIFELLSGEGPPDEAALQQVMAGRMGDMADLSLEYDKLMTHMGRAGETLAGTFRGKGMGQVANAVNSMAQQASLGSGGLRRMRSGLTGMSPEQMALYKSI